MHNEIEKRAGMCIMKIDWCCKGNKGVDGKVSD